MHSWSSRVRSIFTHWLWNIFDINYIKQNHKLKYIFCKLYSVKIYISRKLCHPAIERHGKGTRLSTWRNCLRSLLTCFIELWPMTHGEAHYYSSAHYLKQSRNWFIPATVTYAETWMHSSAIFKLLPFLQQSIVHVIRLSQTGSMLSFVFTR